VETVRQTNRWCRATAAVIACGCAALSLTKPGPALGSSAADSESTGVKITIDQRGAVTGMSSSSGADLPPTANASHMPFRVMVTYSHDGKVSSDPSLVAGADGEVGMDVTIYNTTGRLETVNADVNGRSISREALVSTPMTMAGSVTLDDMDPSKVVTAASRNQHTDPAGNGVVGVDKDGRTVVQWAGLTGVEPLGSVARFSLVVNAHDFHVPTMNLAVTPGFGVQDANTEDENALVVSTIKTLTETTQVLDESGKAIQLATQRLNEAGSNIGNKTISDLKSSDMRIAANAEATAKTISQLAGQTSIAYQKTGSLISGQLAQSTATMKGLLGDPKSSAPQVSVDSHTCKVHASKKTYSSAEAEKREVTQVRQESDNLANQPVLSVIRGLSARLDALSTASDRCQKMVVTDLITMLGPEDPDAKSCTTNPDGLSCALYAQKRQLNGAIKDLTGQNAQFAEQLRKGSQNKMLGKVQQLQTNFEDLQLSVADLSKDSPQAYGQSLKKVDLALDTVTAGISATRNELDRIHAKSQDLLTSADSQDKQIRAVKRELCLASGLTRPAHEEPPSPGTNDSTMTPTQPPLKDSLDPTPGSIDRGEGIRLLDMVSATKCPLVDPGPDASFAGRHHLRRMENSLESTNSQMRSGLAELVEQTELHHPETSQAGSRVARNLDGLDTALKNLRDELHKAQEQRNAGVVTLARHVRIINDQMEILDRQMKDLDRYSSAVGGELSELGTDLDTFVVSTRESADKQLTDNLGASLKNVNSVRRNGKHASRQMFEAFRNDLTEQSEHVAAVGERTVAMANGRMTTANDHLSAQTNKAMQARSAETMKTADGAVADTKQVSGLLAGDIAHVLDDIGQHTDSGDGLLGAISTSAGYLKVADGKMADANSQTHVAQSTQRTVYGDAQVDGAVRRASLARLEQPLTIESSGGAIPAKWMSAQIEGSSHE